MKLGNVIRNLIRNKKITLFFVLLIIVAGVLAYVAMPKQETPDFRVPYAMITTIFPGASQADVDAYVTEPIEQAIESVDGFEASTSYSFNNLSLVVMELTFSADKETSFRQLKEILADLQADLPENCGEISINTDITDTAGVLISLSSDTMTNKEVVAQAKRVEDSLSGIDGFQRFEIIGDLDSVISVKVNETKMQAVGVSFSDIVSLIEAGNEDLPMGNVTRDGEKMTVDYLGGFTGVDDVAVLEIGYSAQLNRVIRLSDIAEVASVVDGSNTYYTHNGQQAVILAGYFEDDINVLPLKDEIQEKLDALSAELPDDLDVSLIISQPEEINESLIGFMNSLLISVCLVILVVLFGMGFKNAVVVSVSLPLSVLMSFLAMYVFGIKIHQISITALILSLGMLVDNSIVVSDAIQNYLDAGEKRMDACVQGVKSVALPILTSTLTTIAAFAPFLFLNSMAGDYIRSLPQIVCIALAASYLSAVFVIPVLGYIFFKPRPEKEKRHTKQFFKRLLEGGLKHRALVIGIVVVLLAGSAYLALNLNMIFFPAADKNILYIDVRNNVSGELDSTQDIMDSLSEFVQSEPGITEYTASAGGALPRFNDILYIYTQTADVGQMMMRVDLDTAGFTTNEDYKAYLQEKIDTLGLNAKVTVKELMYGFPMDEDVKIRITGSDPDMLKSYEDEIYTIITGMDGFINESKGNAKYVDTYTMTIDNAAALQNGIIPAEAQNELSIAMLGRDATIVRNGDDEETVTVSADVQTVEDILSIPLATSSGSYITAGDLITLTETQALSTIPRYDGDYAMTLTADYDPVFNKNDSLAEAKEQIEALNMEDTTVIYGGENALIQENFGQVGVLALWALAIVFIILLIQFKSFTMPLLIFITIPLSVIGSATGLYLTNQPLSFTALLGVVSLLGIVVNNAIILMDYINKESKAGLDSRTACINASMRRLRPILLSSITTVIGLIPLAVGQSQLFRPMAIALMSGLLVSTLLTLVVLPVFMSFTNKRREL